MGPSGGAFLRPAPESFSTSTKSIGTSRTPRMVAISMPENTATPMTFRASAPAPVARTSGTTPRMNANAVIRIGRNRSLADSSAALRASLPCSRSILANSTIRIAFFAARPISMISPICAKMLFR
jgi:hypothetical protein